MLDLRSQTPKGQRARATILEAAEELLVERGFHGTSMRDVAGAAGLPLATVVYHFARKEALYAAVLEAIGNELVERFDRLVHAKVELAARLPPQTARGLAASRVEMFLQALLSWVVAQPGRVKLLLRELLDNPARVAKASRLPLAPFLDRATALIAEAQELGAIAAQPPELAVLHAVGALSYVVAAQPTVDRIVGRQRARTLADAYGREALACARRIVGLPAHPTAPRRRSR
jgi:AcrR family transcriptional regulator